MKRSRRRSNQAAKGAPSGLVISLIFHAVAFFGAGLFIVFTVLPAPKTTFTPPPPVERPRMALKKPKVKVKKSSTPKPASRIVAHVKMAKMPDISIPDLIGAGDGLLNGTGGDGGDGFSGGFGGNLPPVSVMGQGVTDGGDLEGTFYDFKRSRSGQIIDYADGASGMMQLVSKFIKSGCRPSVLGRYYRSPRKLYAKCLVVSPTYSSVAPSAFDTLDSGGAYWMVHYKGKLVHKDGITFRFVCSADYFIVILVDGEIVWAGVWSPLEREEDFQTLVDGKYNPRFSTRKYFMGNDRAMAGEWITLEPDKQHDLDIIIGDEGGESGFIIAVEEEGVEYESNIQGGPILPIFKTANLSHALVDQIFKDLPDGEVCVTNGPVFSDF